MLLPILILVVTAVLVATAAARWLPPLADGRVGELSMVLVCGLTGIAATLIGLHVYEIVRELNVAPPDFGPGAGGLGKPDIVADGIIGVLRDAGTVLGLAGVVYLLAPRRSQAH